MNTVISVQARMGSSRLPGKVLLQLGSRRVIEWVHARCDAAVDELDHATEIVITVGDESENDALVELCRRDGFEWIRGPEEDLLQRHLAVAERYDADQLVRITGDCPFVPPAEIVRTVRDHLQNDCRYTRNSPPSDAGSDSPVGTAVDVFDVELLVDLAELGATHPVRQPVNYPDRWEVSFTPDEQLLEMGPIHAAVDTPTDYWSLVDAIDAVGSDPDDVLRWLET